MNIAAIINEVSKNPCTKHCKNIESDIKPMQIATVMDSFSKNPQQKQCSIPGGGGGEGEGGEGEGILLTRTPSDRTNTHAASPRPLARHETNTISRLGTRQQKTHKPQTSDREQTGSSNRVTCSNRVTDGSIPRFVLRLT